MVGKVFTSLTVLRFVGKSSFGNYMYRCKCACGKTTVVKGTNLRAGKTRSCGCRRGTNFYKHGQARKGKITTEYRLWESARSRAKNSKVPFSISVGDIKIPKRCPIFPSIKLVKNKGRMQDNSPSLDRRVPYKGYVKGNIAVISMRANRMKADMTEKDLQRILNWIKEQK